MSAALIALGTAGCATGQTGDPILVSDEEAVVDAGVISDAGGAVEYWVEYGKTTAYGSETAHATMTVGPNEPTSSSVTLRGLTRASVYHYRVCARDSSQEGGPGCGEDQTFRTQSFACGETVTSDVRFTGNVWCQTTPLSDPGLVIGAAGIMIDMRGFGMTGPASYETGTGPGIDNSAGFDGVTIRDGRIVGFGDGIHLEDASRNRILGMRSIGTDGIDINGGSANEVRRSHAGGRDHGLLAQDTTGLVVADGSANAGVGSGMEFSGLVDGRIVRNDLFTESWQSCCRHAIRVAGNRNVIQENRVSDWAGGLVVVSGADNKLLYNEVFESLLPEAGGNGDASFGDGIFVGAFTSGTVVRGNRTHDNAGDGIEVQDLQTRIADNVANDNDDLGIDAVAGVTDGGGNTAAGNGNPLQCRNVFCQ